MSFGIFFEVILYNFILNATDWICLSIWRIKKELYFRISFYVRFVVGKKIFTAIFCIFIKIFEQTYYKFRHFKINIVYYNNICIWTYTELIAVKIFLLAKIILQWSWVNIISWKELCNYLYFIYVYVGKHFIKIMHIQY